jgi:hypothetical protein
MIKFAAWTKTATAPAWPSTGRPSFARFTIDDRLFAEHLSVEVDFAGACSLVMDGYNRLRNVRKFARSGSARVSHVILGVSPRVAGTSQ